MRGNVLVLVRVCLIVVLALEAELAVAQDSLLKLEAPENTSPLNPDWLGWSEELKAEVSRSDTAKPRRLPEIESPAPLVQRAVGTNADLQRFPVRPIPAYFDEQTQANRMVRYDVPLNDHDSHEKFLVRGVHGTLMEVPVKLELEQRSTGERIRARLLSLVGLLHEEDYPTTEKVVRYEVPADDITLHASLSDLDSEIFHPSMLRLPEVRFFQPKARVFMDLKRENDNEFDLFSNGAVLASLDVVEVYMPMPLISDRFARAMGRPSRLSQIGWRVGGTIGVGITTALTNADGTAGSAPISTMSTGIRYDFPLGRPSREVIETGDLRLDQRTRVGIETGLQGGISSNESLGDSTDLGWYFGILVNTPWTQY